MISRYKRLKDAGLCPCCGGKRDGKTVCCSMCLAFRKEYYRKHSAEQTPEERAYANKKKREHTNARNAFRRQQGLCIRCGAVSPIHWLCSVCYAKKKEKDNENA